MANITGRRAYSTNSGRIVQNVLDHIILVDENINDAAFLAFYGKVGVKNTDQEEFKWDVDTFLATSDAINYGSGYSDSATSIVVDDGTVFNPNDLVAVKRTGEIMSVTSISTNTLTVVREVTNASGGTAAAALLDNDVLVKLSPAASENSGRQIFKSTTPTQNSNYCQQFRWDMNLSRRQVKRAFETGNELPYQQMKQMKEAQMALNRAFLAGEKGRYNDPSGDDVTTTIGMKNVPSSYTWSVGGTLHEYEWDSFLVEEGLRKGSRNKVLFASTAVILALSEMTKDRVEYTLPLGTKTAPIGIKVMEYMAPNGGKLLVVEDRFLSENYDGMAVGCDMTQLKRRVFSRNGFNDDLHFIFDTGDVDDLGTVHTLYGDMGLEYGAEQNHFLITDVTGGAMGRAIA